MDFQICSEQLKKDEVRFLRRDLVSRPQKEVLRVQSKI